MKNILKDVGRFFRAFWGVMFAITAFGGIMVFFSNHRPEDLLATLFCAVVAFLLLKKKKAKPSSELTSASQSSPTDPATTSFVLQDIPKEILQDMKKHYTAVEAQNDARIMAESFKLIQQTTNFETFFSRLELAQQKALTLLQAEKAGCRGIKQLRTTESCNKVLSSSQAAKIVFLDNSCAKETSAALLLKTKAGQQKRLHTYLETLRGYEAQFADVEDAYNETIRKVMSLID